MSFGHSKLIIYSLIAFVIAFSISFSMTAANTNDAPGKTGAKSGRSTTWNDPSPRW